MAQMRVLAAVLMAALGLAAARAGAQTPGTPMGGAAPMGGMAMGHGMDEKLPPAGPLKVSFGDKTAEWTPATLAALPHRTLTVFNEHLKANQTFTGVLLMDLLTPLGVPAMQHGKDLRLYLVAEGSDGYKAVYSVAEVNPDLHEGTVIVADGLEGKPLPGGALQMVAAGEKRPARWVRSLAAVRVLAVE